MCESCLALVEAVLEEMEPSGRVEWARAFLPRTLAMFGFADALRTFFQVRWTVGRKR